MAAQAPLFASIAVLVLLVAAILVGIPRYLASAELDSAREQLASAPPADASLRAQARLAPDAAEQSALMAEVVAGLGAGPSIRVERTVQSDPVEATLAGDARASISLAAGFAPETTRIVDGSWPGSAAGGIPGALHADAAEALELGIGDVLRVGGAEITVVATWSPVDPADPYWFGDPVIATAEASGAYGPLLVEEADLEGLGLNPFVRWTLIPEIRNSDVGAIGAIGEAARSWENAIREAPGIASGGLVFAGGLAATVSEIDRSIAAMQGVAPLPLLLAGGTGAVALLQAFRLLSSVRSSETLLLRARGRSTALAAGLGALETAVVAAPAIAIATIAAWIAVPTAPAGATLATAGGVLLAAVAIGAASTAAPARDAATSRATSGILATMLALAVIAAGVSLWQFTLYGGPLVPAAAGAVVDPLAVLAPSLALVACGLAAVAVLPIVSGAAALLLAGRRGLAVIPARQVSRRATAFAVPVMLTCLAVAVATVAGGYAATWQELSVSTGELRNGSDVRVGLTTAPTVGSGDTIVSSAALSLSDASAIPVLVASTEIGDDPSTLVAMDAGALDTANALGDAAARESLSSAIGSPPEGIALPESATALELRVSGVVGPMSLAAWVSDTHGALARLPLDELADGEFSAPLPRGATPWTLIALDAAVRQTPVAAAIDVRVVEVNGIDDLDPWSVVPEVGGDRDVGAVGLPDALGFSLQTGGPSPALLIRLAPDVAPLAIAVTSTLSERLGIGPGDALRFRFAGTGLAIDGTVAAVVPRIPGTTAPLAALTDLRALNAVVLDSSSSVPRPSELWIRTPDVPGTLMELDSQLPAGSRVTTEESGSGAALQAPVVVALWLGAIGTLLLALAATAAVAGALTRSRRGEIGVYRALGVTGRSQARAQAAELGIVLLLGAALGLAAGVAVSALTVPGLARSAVLDAPAGASVPLALGILPTLAALIGFLIAAGGVIAVSMRRVARIARSSTGREWSA